MERHARTIYLQLQTKWLLQITFYVSIMTKLELLLHEYDQMYRLIILYVANNHWGRVDIILSLTSCSSMVGLEPFDLCMQ